MQAQRRGDEAAAAEYGARLDTIARQMRAAETLINDETGREHYVQASAPEVDREAGA
jgi:hypothetical protein